MIKANDLRIGNFVSVGNPADRKDDLQITYERMELLFLHNTWSRIEPIPLDEGYLKRLGFVVDKAWKSINEYLIDAGKYDLKVDWHPNGENYVYLQSQVNDITYDQDFPHIKFVHQLQNLYYALTGSELALREEAKQ